MRRILVPLDGSKLAESILPEAQELAGPDGELILVREAHRYVEDTYGVAYDQWTLAKVQDQQHTISVKPQHSNEHPRSQRRQLISEAGTL